MRAALLPFAAGANTNLSYKGADIHDPTFRKNQKLRMRLVIVRGRHNLQLLKAKKFSTEFSHQTSCNL